MNKRSLDSDRFLFLAFIISIEVSFTQKSRQDKTKVNSFTYNKDRDYV